eukprot:917984-Prymnesium_polylepis.4
MVLCLSVLLGCVVPGAVSYDNAADVFEVGCFEVWVREEVGKLGVSMYEGYVEGVRLLVVWLMDGGLLASMFLIFGA